MISDFYSYIKCYDKMNILHNDTLKLIIVMTLVIGIMHTMQNGQEGMVPVLTQNNYLIQ